VAVLLLGLGANISSLFLPKISAYMIDSIDDPAKVQTYLIIMIALAISSLLITLAQAIASTIFSEKVALYLRKTFIGKIAEQSYSYIAKSTPGRLLTVVTSDIDAVKEVFSQGLTTLLGALVTLIGSIILLLSINVRLGLYTISVIPFLIICFALVFKKLSQLFRKTQENAEAMNTVINQTIVNSALIRVLHAAGIEEGKFHFISKEAKEIGLKIVKSISALLPIVMILSNLASLIIIWFGGQSVMAGTLSLGEFSAFFSYSAMFIWPLFVLSFVGTGISRGLISLGRINEVINAEIKPHTGTLATQLRGKIEFKNVSLIFTDTEGTERTILKNISFTILPGTKNAIVGPTAAGKTQLFYLIAGLIRPSSGEILIDDRPVESYDRDAYFSQIGLVFQDSIIFNGSILENITLESSDTQTSNLDIALKTAELSDFIAGLPQGINTSINERGLNLSGGQKQRLMLARALSLNPRILLLDDFTARVDRSTEASILQNVQTHYPHTTLISITQKIEPITSYDHIIVLMEGELIAEGTHDALLAQSFEYQQIFESQQTTEKAEGNR